jgi:hypothetical protein
VQVIDDITTLTAEHIPMLENLYKLGMEEFLNRLQKKSNKAIEYFEGKDLEDYIVAGYVKAGYCIGDQCFLGNKLY